MGDKTMTWVTKEGIKIPIKKMTNAHLLNSWIKCRRDHWRLNAIPHLEKELKKRGLL
jgi:hypothetical protein